MTGDGLGNRIVIHHQQMTTDSLEINRPQLSLSRQADGQSQAERAALPWFALD